MRVVQDPRSSHRTLDRNGGSKPFPNDPDHQVDRGSADSRCAMDEACDLEDDDQSYDIRLDPFSHTHRMGEDQVFLKFPEITIMDAYRSELAEAVDSIDRLPLAMMFSTASAPLSIRCAASGASTNRCRARFSASRRECLRQVRSLRAWFPPVALRHRPHSSTLVKP